MSEDSHHEISVELGNLCVEVSGTDPEWVKGTFDQELRKMLQEAGKIGTVARLNDRAHQ